MAQRSLFWDGAVTGDCGPYGNSQIMDIFFRAVLNGTGNQGVLWGWLNKLAVTNGGGLNATVATGAAVLYGLFYESDAATNVVVPNNSTVTVIVRRSWATQTARLTHDGGLGLVQTPGVTYDIPLADVTTVGGAITVITDRRDYCQFSSTPASASVRAGSLDADSVTTGKLVDHTRWVNRGAGTLKADATNPAVWTNHSATAHDATEPVDSDSWQFAHGATNGLWLTLRVPEDITSAAMSIYLWFTMPVYHTQAQYWTYSAWVGAPSAVLANLTGNLTLDEDLLSPAASPWWPNAIRILLGSINVTAGNLVHLYIDRQGAHANDTSTTVADIFQVELSYTADG